jgi:hypothetical protein
LLFKTKGENNGNGVAGDHPEALKIEVENSSNLWRKDAAVFLPVEKIKATPPHFNANAFVIFHAQQGLASRANDLSDDGNVDQIVCLADFVPNETKALSVRYATSGALLREYPKRTQAELSHKFGYRFYRDWRNASDIFGKKMPEMVLQNVGQDGFDSYHEMADWGMDILKVGESPGMGSLAVWRDGKANRASQTGRVTCAIVANGAVRSQIQTKLRIAGTSKSAATKNFMKARILRRTAMSICSK